MKDTRKKILYASARLFAQKGFSGTSVRDIVTMAKVNISAIHYYFGDKHKLYQETLQYLIDKARAKSWGEKMPLPTAQDIETYSKEEALNLLKHMLDYLLETGLSHDELPLERIFTHAELESAPMRKLLLSYLAPYQELPRKLLTRLTGLDENSPELLVISHSILGQVILSECHRLAILNQLGVSRISPQLRAKIKQVVWHNTLAILNSYQKGTKI